MPPRSFAALLVLVVAVLAAPVAGLGSTPSGAPAGDALDSVRPSQQTTATADPSETDTTTGPSGTATPTVTPSDRTTLPPSDVTWRLQLRPDGDARWHVSMTVPIRNAEDAAAFDEVADEFGNAENPLALDFFRAAAAEASAETGREMAITDVSRSTGRVNGTGTLSVSFRWSNFARVDGDRLSVGDGFNTTRGTWLPALNARQTLVIAPPPGYGVTSAPSVGITDGAARWEGPYNLSGHEPWIVYSGNVLTPTSTSTSTGPGPTGSPGTGTPGTETPNGGVFQSLLPIVGLAVLAGVAAAALVVYLRREDGAAESGPEPSDSAATGPGPESGDDSPSTGDTGAATAAGTGAGAGAASGAGADDDIDEGLLSDEERVERLLERNGGRMKQATIVKETGWSNAKVSQLLSSMAEEGRVDKLRIGRENLISFPDEDVTDFDSE